jgi:hypothetical protein
MEKQSKGENMRKGYLLLAIGFLLAAVAIAGVDFSGTWAVNAEKTTAANPAPAGGGGGGGRGGGMGGGEMTIKQTGNELSISTAGRGGNVTETKYTMDGAEHSFEGARGATTYKAVLSGDTLAITGTRTTQQGPVPLNMKYTLSADGKELTVTNVSNFGGQEMTRKTIYDKK